MGINWGGKKIAGSNSYGVGISGAPVTGRTMLMKIADVPFTKDQQASTCDFCIRSDWLLNANIQRVRNVLNDPMSVLVWWSSVFIAGDALPETETGSPNFRARFHTKGFLPHSFHFVAEIIETSPQRLVIRTSGDFDGVGTISIEPSDFRTRAKVEWQVNVSQPYIRPFLRVFRRVFEWNHLWAMRQGQVGLEAYLQADTAPDSPILRPTFPHNFEALRIPSRWRI